MQEKNTIIIKMNEEFASQMEKYNSVFKRLEEENRKLKKYGDVDTIYLLQELEMEVENLREQRQKDQFIISDIQRKFQGISFNHHANARMSRGLEHTKSHQLIGLSGKESSYHPQYTSRQPYYLDRR